MPPKTISLFFRVLNFLLLAGFVVAQDVAEQGAAEDGKFFDLIGTEQATVFLESLIQLIGDLETNECDLTPGDRQDVIDRLNTRVFWGEPKSVEEAAELISSFLYEEMEQKNCRISEDDPAIRAFVVRTWNLIQNFPELAASVKEELNI